MADAGAIILCPPALPDEQQRNGGAMKFLGTGAGAGTPNPFCRCRICENARKVKGREIRTRSSFLLDSKTVIDIGADYFAQSFLYDTCFAETEHVLYTHMHDDHINYTMMWERLVRRSSEQHTLNVYLAGDAYRFITDFYKTSLITKGCEACLDPKNINIVKLEHGKEYMISGYKITPVKANHETSFEKNGSNYLIEQGGKKLFYGLDTGGFSDEALELLKGAGLDVLITECTFPAENHIDGYCGHMDLTMLWKNLAILYEIRAINDKTRVYISHIEAMGKTHEELCAYTQNIGKPYRVITAYDNMEIEL